MYFLTRSALLAVILVLLSFSGIAFGQNLRSRDVNTRRDGAFWNRVLEDDMVFSTMMVPSLMPSSLATTMSPTDSSTAPPTDGTNTSDRCNIEVSIDCADEDGVPCNDLMLETILCEEGPQEVVMLFNGGDCTQSFNSQPLALFQCFDFFPPEGAGPPPLNGTVYIQAFATNGGEELYFDGEVEVGTEFSLRPPRPGGNSGRFAPDTTILIRQDVTSNDAMQLINFHSSCSRNLFLKDRFGSAQIVGWTNKEQGTVDSKKHVFYNYTVTNMGTQDLELLSLTAATFDPAPGEVPMQESTIKLPRAMIEPGERVSVSVPVILDLATTTKYAIRAQVVGRTIGGPNRSQCKGKETLEFVAGGNLVPSPVQPDDVKPSPPPPPQPSASSPAPTHPTTEQGCVLEATVECVLPNGAPCSLLEPIPPNDLTCVVANGPTELGWIYRGTNCNDDDESTSGVECTDFHGGPYNSNGNSVSSFVNVLVRNAANDVIFRAMGIAINTYFVIPSNSSSSSINSDGVALLDEAISITIYTGREEEVDSDDILQIISGIPTGCAVATDDGDDDDDKLKLGTIYGAVEFASYRKNEEEETLVKSVQPVEWRYSVVKVATTAVPHVQAFLSVVLVITNGETLLLTPNIFLGSDDNDDDSTIGESNFTLVVSSEIRLIVNDDETTTRTTYTGEISAAATSATADRIECGASASSSVTLSSSP